MRKTTLMLGLMTSLALFGIANAETKPVKQYQIDPLTRFINQLIEGNSHPVNTNASHTINERHNNYHAHGGSTVLTSYYGHGERLNAHTSNGERFNPFGLTAAHRTLPLGTRLLVSHNGKTIVVRVNDRGPASWTGRSLDLSYGAARALGITSQGIARVQIAQIN